MYTPRIQKGENEHLKVLQKYNQLNTLPEKEYDDITQLASEICNTPISLISLLDEKRKWFKFKSCFGLSASEPPKEVAFCAHAINDRENILIVPDARKDNRFFKNTVVVSAPHIVYFMQVYL